ncbi:MAG: SO_0444 family Cu/Zn efflux transporter [Kiritimatiellae bacterium]|nr:SO_0444 family Cu/Zn efflux transporter [Kiritimatiellia bacterium]
MWQQIIWVLLSAIWGTLCEMAPYLLFGFLMAGLLSVFISPEIVERHLSGRGMWPVVKASFLGVPLPLCSCGVIPVAASLRRHGASRGATTAFLLSTPQTGVDSIVVTYSLMGGLFALIRPVVALITGLVGGWLVDTLAGQDCGNATGANPPAPCAGACCALSARRQNRLTRALCYGFVTLPRDIGKALMVGLIISGVIAAFVPDDFFAGVFGTGLVGMLIMMVVGMPLYVCATGSVPVAAALMMKGVSPGAALVFLMTGPATNAATLAIIWKVLGKKTVVIYLLTLAVCALTCGLLLDYFLQVAGLPMHHHDGHTMIPRLVNNVSGVILLAVLAWAYLDKCTRLQR